MKIAVTAKIRSGVLFQYREKHNLSQRECAEQAGVSKTAWCAVECMRFDKVYSPSIKKIAEFIGVNVEEIVPEELRGRDSSFKHTKYGEMAPDHLLSLDTKTAMMLPAPDPSVEEVADKNSLRERIEGILAKLTYREREVVKLRWGIADGLEHSLRDVAKTVGATRERVRQVEAKAIRKMKNDAECAAVWSKRE